MFTKINNEYKKEGLRLAYMCLANNIPFEIAAMEQGLIIGYPSLEQDRVSDAICHKYSYGGNSGKLEIMGLLTSEEAEEDSVLGYLTAEEVFMRWNEHWLNNHKEG